MPLGLFTPGGGHPLFGGGGQPLGLGHDLVPEAPDFFIPPLDCEVLGGVPLEPPRYADVLESTKDCFRDEYGLPPLNLMVGWPDHDCPAPCVFETDCELPDQDALAQASATFQQVVMSTATSFDETLIDLTRYADGTTPEDLGELSDLVAAATALLLENIDLLDWAVCLACTWSPNVPDDRIQDIVDCVRNGFLGEKVVYLIENADASGFATDYIVTVDQYATLEAGHGIVLPIGRSPFPLAAGRFAGTRGVGTSCAGAMCAALAWSAVMIHEMLHLCAGTTDAGVGLIDDAAQDGYDCWAIQRMAATSFMWAMAQRFPELRDLPQLIIVPVPSGVSAVGSLGIVAPGPSVLGLPVGRVVYAADCCAVDDKFFMSHQPEDDPEIPGWPWEADCATF